MENGICQLRGNETGSWFEVKDLNSLVTRADRRGSAGGEAAPPGTFYNILALKASIGFNRQSARSIPSNSSSRPMTRSSFPSPCFSLSTFPPMHPYTSPFTSLSLLYLFTSFSSLSTFSISCPVFLLLLTFHPRFPLYLLHPPPPILLFLFSVSPPVIL